MTKLVLRHGKICIPVLKNTESYYAFNLLILLFFCVSNKIYADTLLDFNFENNELNKGFGNWQYIDKGANCDVYDGINFSKLCSTISNNKFYPYYNFRNNAHMGWLRYGYIDSNDKYSIAGSSLKVTLTGGAYQKNSGEIGYSGAPIFSKIDLQDSPEDNFGDPEQVLPAAFSFYYKSESATTKFSELQNKNRLTLWVLMPKLNESFDYYQKSNSLARPNQTFGLYPFINTSLQGHYYHSVSNIPMGGWTKIQFDAHPQHHNSGSNNPYSAFSVGGYEYPGDGIAYFSNTTALSFVAGFSSYQKSPYSFYIDEIKSSLVLYENDETINNLAIGYDQTNKIFDVSLSDKYRCLECAAKYQIRYSFSPITQSNFEQAHVPQETINFNRTHNNNVGEIIKPNPGYNNIWAAIKLQAVHTEQLVDNTTVYFAIIDISDRSNIEQESIDFQEQLIPNIGKIKTIDLIKTIDYTIHIIDYPLTIKTKTVEEGIIGQYFSDNIEFFGGISPHNFTNTSPLPTGLTLDSSGVLSGIPEEPGEFELSVLLKDHINNQIKSNVTISIKSPEDFIVENCIGIVDFGEQSSLDTIISNAFDVVISDKYTGNFKQGKTITIGENGGYDFQGVEGNGLTLLTGDTVRAIWYNNSDIKISFTPLISFNDSNRRNQAPAGKWFDMEAITINPKQYHVSNYIVSSEQSKFAPLINISVNYSNNKTLILDKVEYISTSLSTNDTCLTPYALSQPPESPVAPNVLEKTIVDFHKSDSESTFYYDDWATIIRDKYTNYYQDGLTITIGSNADYDFQGVRGSERQFEVDDQITVYWQNISEQTINFTPNISFTDPDRKYNGDVEGWFKMNSLEILPMGYGTSSFTVDSSTQGAYSLININSNVSFNKKIILDKITLSSSIEE